MSLLLLGEQLFLLYLLFLLGVLKIDHDASSFLTLFVQF